jgi:hypothetical protein
MRSWHDYRLVGYSVDGMQKEVTLRLLWTEPSQPAVKAADVVFSGVWTTCWKAISVPISSPQSPKHQSNPSCVRTRRYLSRSKSSVGREVGKVASTKPSLISRNRALSCGLSQAPTAWAVGSWLRARQSMRKLPNSALLPDTYPSPLRARRGAANRER